MDKVSKMLAHILDRATPDVHVTAARIARWPTEGSYFINVYPAHMEYWMTFKRTYPYWKRVAAKYNVAKFDTLCPEFPTRKELLDWLSDTIGLSQGERNLLYFCVKK